MSAGRIFKPIPWTTRIGFPGSRWGGGRFTAAGGTGAILTSPDAISWTQRREGVARKMFAAGSGPEELTVAVGAGGTILSSSDLATWLPRSSGYRALSFEVQALMVQVPTMMFSVQSSALDRTITPAICEQTQRTEESRVTQTALSAVARVA